MIPGQSAGLSQKVCLYVGADWLKLVCQSQGGERSEGDVAADCLTWWRWGHSQSAPNSPSPPPPRPRPPPLLHWQGGARHIWIARFQAIKVAHCSSKWKPLVTFWDFPSLVLVVERTLLSNVLRSSCHFQTDSQSPSNQERV